MAAKDEVADWLRRILSGQRRRLNAALGLAVISAALFILQSWVLASLFGAWLQAWHGAAPVAPAATWWLPALLACLLLRPLLQFGRERLSQRASWRARGELRDLLLQRLAALGPARRALGADAQLASQALEQVDALDGYISRYQVQRQLVILVPLMLLVATAWHSPLAAILLLLTAPLLPLFMVLLGHAAANASQRQFVALGRMSGRFLDLLRGLRTLRHLQVLGLAQGAVEQAAEDYRSRTMRVLRMAFLSTAVLELFASIAIAMLALYLGMGLLGMLPWSQSEVPVPYQAALFILLLAPEFYAPLRQLGADYHARAEAQAAVTELLPLLQLTAWQHPGDQPLHFHGAPAIDCVGLTVAEADLPVRLPPLTLNLAAGDQLLLQGASGSGKSTFLHALLGFLPYEGEILINGQLLSRLDRRDWHAQVSYLAQQPELLPGTVADNLRLAAPDAGDDALIGALQEVGLWELLRRLPLQLETPLGERGLGLSGGQLSRLALARMLLRDTPVWLLDEPLAHLDPDTAQGIGALLERLSRGRTLILVSHEVTGLEWMQRRLVLEASHG